ncbi:LysR family transcriptional regulator [Actinoplanes couchii]|uniref:LysR family transcriptional regulator n=1 Tax=Actinoplanes couchii TaxID=403638 RepID=A0ABQ3X1H9_9ACTN|nr:LysR substrate-binding domain-containing protein [Actinoplanes couchii]MDR6316634.1 molybdate transport repressor ModE-like protein [Actinoplanes couchii]GID52248.1 LysR family transcriptional regulator [Actinoplanes couchii]
MIDPRRLRVLTEVARHGSFNRAAAELRLTPSAVSQQISALERAVGTAVVRRSTRGVELTAAGRVLTGTAETIDAELRLAENEIARLATRGVERLTVATFTSGGQRILPHALLGFTRDHPAVELTVIESEPEDSLPLVRSGGADLALVYHFDGPPPVPAGLDWLPLLDDPMWIVVPAGHRHAGRTALTIAELGGERWVHGCLSISEMLDHYAALAGIEVETACRGTDYQFAQSLVRAGVGIAMIPEVALTADASGLHAARLVPPAPCRYVGVATSARRRTDPVVTALLRTLRATVGALPATPLATA